MCLSPGGRVAEEDVGVGAVLVAAGDDQVSAFAAVIGELLGYRHDQWGFFEAGEQGFRRDWLGAGRYAELRGQVGDAGDAALHVRSEPPA